MGSPEVFFEGPMEACPDAHFNLDLTDRQDSQSLAESYGTRNGTKRIVRRGASGETEGGHFKKRKRWGVHDDIVDEIIRGPT